MITRKVYKSLDTLEVTGLDYSLKTDMSLIDVEIRPQLNAFHTLSTSIFAHNARSIAGFNKKSVYVSYA